MEAGRFDLEVDRNYDAFEAALPSLLPDKRGQFALLRGGTIVHLYASEGAALMAGRQLFDDGLFSVQEVTDRPVDLGFFSHAIDPRIA